jgi:hypothetical protein
MRSLVAAFLIPQLVALPVTQVLAQAQQEPQVTQTEDSRVTIPAPTSAARTSQQPRFLAVPTVEPNSPAALLLAAEPIDRTFPSDSLAVFRTARTSRTAETALLVGVILVVAFLVLLAACDGKLEGCLLR